jgi:hypothetical protein
VATISVIYTTLGNFTVPPRTETVYNTVPPEYSLYDVGADEQGTAVVTVPITESGGSISMKAFTYPTPYIDYLSEYHWNGVLQTHNKEFEPVCTTSNQEFANVPLAKHPEYPQLSEVPTPGENDSLGNQHRPLWVPIQDERNKTFFDYVFPSESAFLLCKSALATTPLPSQFSAPKFVTVYTTIYTTPQTADAPDVQPTATGWEETSLPCCRHTPAIPHIQSTASGFEGGSGSVTRKPAVGPSVSSKVVHEESTTTGFGGRPPHPPLAQNTANPGSPGNNAPPGLPDILVNVINKNLGLFSSAIQSQEARTTPTAVFTFVTTILDGRPTTILAFVLPGSSATATIGETVTLNGQATVLSAPETLFTKIPTMINGVATSVPAYIISGTSTARIGQTVVLDETTAVLSIPTSTVEGGPGPGRPQETGGPLQFQGFGHSSLSISRSALLLAIVFGNMIWL